MVTKMAEIKTTFSGIDFSKYTSRISEFVDEFGTVAALDRYYDKVNYLDVNASYTFGKRCKTTIYAEANNLLNQPLRYYQGTKDRTMQLEYYGIRANLGVKFQF